MQNMEETRMGKTSSAAKNKYNAKTYDRITIIVPKGDKANIAAYAAGRGESTTAFIKRAIRETMERDQAPEG